MDQTPVQKREDPLATVNLMALFAFTDLRKGTVVSSKVAIGSFVLRMLSHTSFETRHVDSARVNREST